MSKSRVRILRESRQRRLFLAECRRRRHAWTTYECVSLRVSCIHSYFNHHFVVVSISTEKRRPLTLNTIAVGLSCKINVSLPLRTLNKISESYTFKRGPRHHLNATRRCSMTSHTQWGMINGGLGFLFQGASELRSILVSVR